jgi:hypothetical protein
MMKACTHTEEAAFIGIDWADRTHDVCLPPAGCDTREFSALPHRSERMAPWALRRPQRFEGRPIAVCPELRKGPRVCALQPSDCLVRFAVQPAPLAKYRDAFGLSHAQDDPTDAELALERLLMHRDKLPARQPHSVARRAWQRLVAQRRALVADKGRAAPIGSPMRSSSSSHRSWSGLRTKTPWSAVTFAPAGPPSSPCSGRAKPACGLSSLSTTCAIPTSSRHVSKPSCRPRR